MSQPVIFCFDGSEGSRRAMHGAAGLVAHPVEAIVLTVWTPAIAALARAGGFMVTIPNEADLDNAQEARATAIAEEGAAAGRESGYEATARVVRADDVPRTILEIADEVDARLIVCGQRGRGPITSAVLGSVSHALTAHAKRPVLVVPEHVPAA